MKKIKKKVRNFFLMIASRLGLGLSTFLGTSQPSSNEEDDTVTMVEDSDLSDSEEKEPIAFREVNSFSSEKYTNHNLIKLDKASLQNLMDYDSIHSAGESDQDQELSSFQLTDLIEQVKSPSTPLEEYGFQEDKKEFPNISKIEPQLEPKNRLRKRPETVVTEKRALADCSSSDGTSPQKKLDKLPTNKNKIDKNLPSNFSRPGGVPSQSKGDNLATDPNKKKKKEGTSYFFLPLGMIIGGVGYLNFFNKKKKKKKRLNEAKKK